MEFLKRELIAVKVQHDKERESMWTENPEPKTDAIMALVEKWKTDPSQLNAVWLEELRRALDADDRDFRRAVEQWLDSHLDWLAEQ